MSRARNLAGFGSAIETAGNPVNIQVGVVTAIKLFGDGSELTGTPGGLGTALSQDLSDPLNKIYYTDQNLSIGATITVDPPDSSKVAYTQYANILMEGDADLIVADGDDLITDILGISTLSDQPGILQNGNGRIRVDNIADKSGLSSPAFPYGLTVSAGAAATFSGDVHLSSSQILGTGTTAAPIVSRTGDTDTGLFFPSDGVVAITADGNEALRAISTGRLGIGTDNPEGTIHVLTNTNNQIVLESTDSIADLIGADPGGSTRFRSSGGQFTFYTGGDASSHNASGSTSRLQITGGGNINVAAGSTLQLGDSSITGNQVYRYEEIAGGSIKKYYVSDTLNAGQLTRFTFQGTDRTSAMITINATGSWTASNTSNNHPAAQFMCRVFTNSSGTSSDNSTVTTPFAYTYTTGSYAFNNAGGNGYSIDITNPTGDDGVSFFYEVIVQSAVPSSQHAMTASSTA